MKKGGLPGKRRASDGARVGNKEKGRGGRVARVEKRGLDEEGRKTAEGVSEMSGTEHWANGFRISN